jgi:hypothetical protein
LLLLGSNFAFFFNLSRGLNGNRGGGTLFKFVYGAGGIKQLLFARIKRVALTADFRVKCRRGRTGGKTIAAGAGYHDGGIELRMDGIFHRILVYGVILNPECI